jgi:hypothetical protein
LAVDGDGVALEWFRNDGVVERFATEALGPLDPGGLVAGGDVGDDSGKRGGRAWGNWSRRRSSPK